jgi:hypothetical protein
MLRGLSTMRALIGLVLISPCVAAQVHDKSTDCASPEIVLQRYVDAIGGDAVHHIQSRTMTTRESNNFRGRTEHYVYKFKWKAPDKVSAGSTPYLFNSLPISYPNGTFIFDGQDWSNFDRRRSRNEERDPPGQRELKHKYLYNEDPEFLEFRVLSDPLIIARAQDLYARLEVGPNSTETTETSGLCILRAHGIDQWRYQREDLLYFDASSGFLKTWKIQAGLPPHKTYVQFQFNDYRPVGAIKFPFYIYFDFYDATFRYTEVVQDKPLADSEFLEKPARP